MLANPNLQILGLQAIPRLAKKLDLHLGNFPTYTDLYRTTPEEFRKACDDCGGILNHLFETFHISWWDVYLNSDVGMERMALARDIGLEKGETVLEIGCGRGYFTIAAARTAKRVTGLDLMDGVGRYGWWSNLEESVTELGLKHKILALRADAQTIPLKDRAVCKVVAAHSIRNFQSRQAIKNSLREMNRTLSTDGEIIVAENLPIARNKSQEAHLALYRCKCKYDSGDLFYFSQKELLEIFREAGLTEVQIKVVDYNMSAAPPIFYLNASALVKKQIEKAQREYKEAVDMVERYGETSPPVAIIKANKHSE